MEPVEYADREAEVRRTREMALAQRPMRSPLPDLGTWQKNCQQYWLAALEFFQAAQQFYQAGDQAQGDYCMARGDAYLQMALVCTHIISRGVAASPDFTPAEHDPEAEPPSLARFEAKREEARSLLDRQAYPPPHVLASAPLSECDAVYYKAWDNLSAAVNALGVDSVAYYYYLAESDYYFRTWYWCVGLHGL